MARINSSALPTTSISEPGYLVIDDLDYLAVLSSTNKLYRYNQTTMTLVTGSTLSGSNYALSHYNKQYFVSKYNLCF
jgi:hypothetical protein